MSAREIIAELPNLDREELRLVEEKAAELRSVTQATDQPVGWSRALAPIIGAADDLPEDLSLQHDHYLYGTSKRPA